MIEKKINLEEILNKTLEISESDSLTTISKDSILLAMLEFGQQLLELAVWNAKVRTISQVTGDPVNMEDWEYRLYKVDGRSILDTIKQVE